MQSDMFHSQEKCQNTFISQPFTEFAKQRAVYMIIYRKVNEDTYSVFSRQKLFMR